ncbi:MAG: hypothetical protein ACPL3E_01295, partial [Minisyncoccia bacterium]
MLGKGLESLIPPQNNNQSQNQNSEQNNSSNNASLNSGGGLNQNNLQNNASPQNNLNQKNDLNNLLPQNQEVLLPEKEKVKSLPNYDEKMLKETQEQKEFLPEKEPENFLSSSQTNQNNFLPENIKQPKLEAKNFSDNSTGQINKSIDLKPKNYFSKN